MNKRGKKGLSGVITTLILILISLVAIGIIWVVIANMISEQSEQVNIDSFTIKLKIEQVLTNGNQTNITINRGVGAGEVDGIKVIISDGTTPSSFDINSPIYELDTNTYTLEYGGIIKSVSVAPLFSTSSGEMKMGSSSETKTYSYEETIKNIPGLISWWRMDGNGNDEMNNNNADPGTSSIVVEGKHGQAYGFTGNTVQQTVGVSDDASLSLGTSISILAWINKKSTGTEKPILAKWYTPLVSMNEYKLVIDNTESLNFWVAESGGTNNGGLASTNKIPLNNWTHVAATLNSSEINLYINGEKDPSKENWNYAIQDTTFDLFFGTQFLGPITYNFFNGTIDEAMIFNRALSAQEIKGIYGLSP